MMRWLVRGVERRGNLTRDGQCFVKRQRAAREAIGERLTVDTSDQFGMTSARRPSDASNWSLGFLEPVDCAMPGWLRDASVLASRSKRASRSGSRAKTSGRILIATSRSSRVSRAR